jgi:hypothetical protein
MANGVDSANERWLPIPGFEGLYEVSDQGRVRSLDRVVHKRAVRGGPLIQTRRRGKVLKQSPDTHGYPMLNLCVGGVSKGCLVHHLVLAAFVGPRPVGQECRHLDGTRTNGALANLCWGTPLQNTDDRRRHGTMRIPRGIEHGMSKLTAQGVLEIRSRARAGESVHSIATRYRVSMNHVRQLVRRKSWGWLDEQADSAVLVLEAAER